MKMTRIALAIATAAMVSTPVLATNGDVLIGLGAQSRALGGTGTAAFFGSENALINPALLGKSQGSEFSIGGTAFMPNVEASTDVASQTGPVSQTSDNDLNVIPEVSMSTRINENLTFGLGMFGSAGMGVDYRDNGGLPAGAPNAPAAADRGADGTGLFNGYSNLQLMKFAPSLAYNQDNFGIGFAPVIQYGSLDINYMKYDTKNTADSGADDTLTNVGNGMSTDLGFGYNIGGYFDVSKDLTIALAYQSAIEMEYDDQITVAAGGFGLTQFTDKLEQPAEIKIGAAYTMGNIMLTADAKQIKWGDAEGYSDFGWEDQNVFALGAKYSADKYWVGAGYNFGEDPITEADATTYAGQATNMFNNHFFPGVVESHMTFGGGYSLSKNMMLEAAVVYAPEVEKTIDTGLISNAFSETPSATPSADATSHTVKHSQLGYTVSVKMNF
jgi:long-chain fatty acid transport protein